MKKRVKDIAVAICRLTLALTFILSGFAKLNDPMGMAYKLTEYIYAFNLDILFPHSTLVLILAIGLGTFEFLMGIMMLFAANRRTTTTLTLLFMLAMTPLTLYLALNDPVSDCGCFGTLLQLTGWQTFGKNTVLLVAAIVTTWWNDSMTPLVSDRGQWMIRLYTTAYAVALAAYSLVRLPLIDTMAYRIGTHIGETDETITFVALDPQTGDDRTDEMLGAGYTLLLVSDNLDEANDGEMDRINVLATYAVQNDMRFAMLTASEDNAATTRWRDLTGAEYPILWSDETTLRTMVRSNPGLMLLKDGQVMRKWSHTDIPGMNIEDFELEPDEQQWTQTDIQTKGWTLLRLTLWFFIPLTIWTFLDMIYKRIIQKQKH